MFSRDLLRETIWTLDLLFPSSSDEIGALLRRWHQDFHLIVSPERAPSELRQYHYWRERLHDLVSETYAAPRTLRAALVDYRNPLQWWTFWLAVAIAVMTFAFGSIAAVFAGLTWAQGRSKN